MRLLGGCAGRLSLVFTAQVATLVRIAEKGMATAAPEGIAVLGPTIMDVNSGWVLASGAHQPSAIYARQPSLFTESEFSVYGDVTQRLKGFLEAEFSLPKDSLFFTAPTFITREAAGGGETGSWEPTTMHDEYW